MKTERKTNPLLVQLIKDLKRVGWSEKAPIWRDIANRLEKPLKNWSEVNVSRIARYANEGETVIVPGKLLGSGEIGFPVSVAAYNASKGAKKKIRNAGGKVMTIQELVRTNPRGKRVRILG